MAGFLRARAFAARFFNARFLQPESDVVVVEPQIFIGNHVGPRPAPNRVVPIFTDISIGGFSIGVSTDSASIRRRGVIQLFEFGISEDTADLSRASTSGPSAISESGSDDYAEISISNEAIRRSHNALMFELAA
jgi:hypothetical protein